MEASTFWETFKRPVSNPPAFYYLVGGTEMFLFLIHCPFQE
jgi:hypothetical protein